MRSGKRSGKVISILISVCLITICFSSCAGQTGTKETNAAIQTTDGEMTAKPNAETQSKPDEAATGTNTDDGDMQEMRTMKLKIDNADVAVDWEDNESVAALKTLVAENPLTIRLSMYGGFEQVGSLGTNLPRDDVQTTTQAGDIVLYSGNQIVLFYGSNSWAYTKLGHITDQDASGMAGLLSNGNVTITISMEDAE